VRRRWLGPVAVAAATFATGCGTDDVRPLVIDERRGTVAGVGIGDKAAEIRRVFGERPFANGGGLAPADSNFVEDGGPAVVRTPAPCNGRRSAPPLLRYDEVSFLFCGGRAYAFMVTGERARTTAAAAIGDSLADAAARYGGRLSCRDDAPGGESPFGGQQNYPYCVGRVAASRWLWLGEDELGSIAVASTSLDPHGG